MSDELKELPDRATTFEPCMGSVEGYGGSWVRASSYEHLRHVAVRLRRERDEARAECEKLRAEQQA